MKALKQALDEDYLQTRFDDAEQKLRAALRNCGKACSVDLRARLHVALASVLAGGKKALSDARDEFVEALALDPRSKPSADMLSTEVSFAYEQARKQVGLTPGADAKAAGKPASPERVEKDEAPSTPPPPPPEPDPALKNWVSLSFSPDLAFVSGSNVCTAQSQSFDHYVCLRPDVTRYLGTPTLNNGDKINAGIAIATMRFMLGYERLVHPNVTVGVRAGFAFDGAPSGVGASFLPVHLEGRLGLWPGHDPFAGAGVHPYFMLSGGMAQVDARFSAQVLEDGVACGAATPSNTQSPCTKASSDGTVEQRQQTLTVYKQNGLGFTSLAFGVRFAPSIRVALHLAVRAGVTFPVLAAVLSPEAGLSVGF